MPKHKSGKWDTPWYTTRGRCTTILYHGIENTVPSTIDETYVGHTMGRLGVTLSNMQRLISILIRCIFFLFGINIDIHIHWCYTIDYE